MKIAVISDTHFGYGYGTPREEDSFRNANEAFQLAADADIILMPGDIFDRKKPKQSVLARAIDIFRDTWRKYSSLEAQADGEKWECNNTPIVAIHGTHERRSDGMVNPIQLLERAGLLYHLHNDKIMFRDDTGEEVIIHGMSGVPERYAPAVLEKYNPRPVQGCFNVLLIHQSVEQFVYTDESTEALSIEDFPKGFDYIIDGHIHWRRLELKDDAHRPFVIPGSTITTQLNDIESKVEKGILFIDTSDGSLDFQPLSEPRDVIVGTVDVSDMVLEDIVARIKQEYELDTDGRRSLLKVELVGEPSMNVSSKEVESSLDDVALATVTRRSSQTVDNGENQETRELPEASPTTVGDKMIREAVSYDRVDDLLSLLVEEETEKAVDLLRTSVPEEGLSSSEHERNGETIEKETGSTEDREKNTETRDSDDGDDTGRTENLGRFVD